MGVETSKGKSKRRGRQPIGIVIADLPPARREELRRLALSTGMSVGEIDKALRLGESGVGLSALRKHVRALRRQAGLEVPGRRGPASINWRVAQIAAAELNALIASHPPERVEAIVRQMMTRLSVNPDEVAGLADKPESVT